MIIKVTQEHIDLANKARASEGWNGFKGHSQCPIAQVCPGIRPWIGAHSLSFTDNYSRVIRELPAEARAFIVNWDNGENPEPFEFEIDYEAPKSDDEASNAVGS